MSGAITYSIAGSDLSKLKKELRHSFSIQTKSRESNHYSIYDTFDWRLFNHSLVLSKNETRLCVDRLSNEHVGALELTQVPRFVREFPEGQVRNLLAPILQVRALLKLVDFEVATESIALLDSLKKTVARIQINRIVNLATPDANLNQLKVYPVKGYRKQFIDLTAWLQSFELQDPSTNIFVEIMKLAGLEPGGYSSKLRVSLNQRMAASQASCTILRQLLSNMQINEAGIIDNIDSEFLHDFRVSIRRTRAFLSQVPKVLPKKVTQRFREEFSFLGGLTNEARDLDVYLLKMQDFKKMLPETMENTLKPLVKHLEAQRIKVQRKLVSDLKSERYRKIISDWDEFLEKVNAQTRDKYQNSAPIISVARTRIYKTFKRVIKKGRAIKKKSAPELLHELRLECKKLRYLMEFFSSIFPPAKIKFLVSHLKTLQDNLGAYQDLFVQKQRLFSYVEELESRRKLTTNTTMAIGFIIGTLDKEHENVRAQFDERFRQFDDEEVRTKFKSLFS